MGTLRIHPGRFGQFSGRAISNYWGVFDVQLAIFALGLTVGLLRQPPTVGDGRETEPSDLAESWAADLQRLGARVVDARIPEPSAVTGGPAGGG